MWVSENWLWKPAKILPSAPYWSGPATVLRHASTERDVIQGNVTLMCNANISYGSKENHPRVCSISCRAHMDNKWHSAQKCVTTAVCWSWDCPGCRSRPHDFPLLRLAGFRQNVSPDLTELVRSLTMCWLSFLWVRYCFAVMWPRLLNLPPDRRKIHL